jgi:hypothetical protein
MISCMLLLAFALAASASHASDVEHFTASANGKLTIGADGRVLDVEVEGANGGRLGRPVAKAFEEHIRNWRFEPITQDGMPVNVVGHMKLSLVATRVRGEKEAVFGIRKVWFLDPPKTRAGSPGASPAHRMPAPSYPKEPMSEGVGAEVMLALKLGPDGRATEVATQSLSLLGNISSQENIRRRHARVLRHSAENAGKRWTFEGFADGEVVLVPVRYHPGFDSAWLHTVALNVDVPLWVLARMADETAVRFDGGGQPLSTQIKLDTPLVDPITPAAGG